MGKRHFTSTNCINIIQKLQTELNVHITQFHLLLKEVFNETLQVKCEISEPQLMTHACAIKKLKLNGAINYTKIGYLYEFEEKLKDAK